MSRPKKPAGLPRIKMTPTKHRAILMYQDECHRSFNWIANEAPLFQNTSANHTTISKAYDATQQHGCYYKLYRPGRPPVISEKDLDQGIADLDNGDATDGANLQWKWFISISHRTVYNSLHRHGLLGFVRHQKATLNICNFASCSCNFIAKYMDNSPELLMQSNRTTIQPYKI
ncbi:hypothetical protein BT96DRAFT_1005264 [Gymnopus androsaceus JB14]|uniref:Uncharacterized protein n=1 Tax=Gymnopus androsaceus JB14 TaxID=1447944 RepID=A0A6A4GND5_9AGAR|nr:hypothetical protein BT96DRAFT_1005264 [Gymnopus androsaceus JB14]